MISIQFCHLVSYSTSFFSHSDNTEIVINSVIILFVCHLDELLYGLLRVFPQLLSRMSQEGQDEFDVVFRKKYCEAIERQQITLCIANLTEDVCLLLKKVKLLEEHCPDLNKLPDLAPAS